MTSFSLCLLILKCRNELFSTSMYICSIHRIGTKQNISYNVNWGVFKKCVSESENDQIKKKNWRHCPELVNVAKTMSHLLVQKRKYVALQTYEIQTTLKKFRALKESWKYEYYVGVTRGKLMRQTVSGYQSKFSSQNVIDQIQGTSWIVHFARIFIGYRRWKYLFKY
jgi:hypothetical protein